MTAGWCSRTSCAPRATVRSCSASSRTATPRPSPSSTRSRMRWSRRARRRRRACRSRSCSTSRCSSRRRSRGLLREGAIAAGLTALMIVLFLGSWRSTLVVMITIPLAILSSLVVLYFLGDTHQHHDAGRARARDRHPGRRFHGHDRKYASPADRGRHGAAAGDAARRRRHRRSDLGVDTRHQLRLRFGRVPARAGQISVHAARSRGGVRHAGVLRPLAHPDADHHRPPAQGRASRNGRLARLVRASAWALRARL